MDYALTGPLEAGVARDARERVATLNAVELYRALVGPVFTFIHLRVGHRQNAEDLTAEVFERVLAGLAGLRKPERTRSWVFSIARNAITDHWRRHAQRHEVGLLDRDALTAHAVASPEQSAEEAELWAELRSALADLNDREREIVALRFAGGLRHREIAELTGLKEANVGQITHRVLNRLRAQFTRKAEHAS
ncbi:MAG: sigma-70 family RNA polymerase sigma factor [Chloroflexota bacterium]